MYSKVTLYVLQSRTKLVFRALFSLPHCLTLQQPLLTAGELDELAKQSEQDFLDLDMEQLPQLAINPAQKKLKMDVAKVWVNPKESDDEDKDDEDDFRHENEDEDDEDDEDKNEDDGENENNQPCYYGTACTFGAACSFTHPAALPPLCRYGANCRTAKCRFLHPKNTPNTSCCSSSAASVTTCRNGDQGSWSCCC